MTWTRMRLKIIPPLHSPLIQNVEDCDVVFSDEPRRAQSMRRYLPDACDYAPENVYLKFHLFDENKNTFEKHYTV